MPALGPVLTWCGLLCRASTCAGRSKGRSRRGAACDCGGRRCAPTALRCSGPWPARITRCARSLRSTLRQDAPEVSTRRAARAGHEPCAPRRFTRTPRPARTALCGRAQEAIGECLLWFLSGRLCPAGVGVCGAEQRSVQGRARSALRGQLTCRILFERSERSERSELCGTPSRRAAQGSRCAAPTATVGDAAGHRLTRPARIVERGQRTATNTRKVPQADPSRPRDRQPLEPIPLTRKAPARDGASGPRPRWL